VCVCVVVTAANLRHIQARNADIRSKCRIQETTYEHNPNFTESSFFRSLAVSSNWGALDDSIELFLKK
jgi:hypothetical protein